MNSTAIAGSPTGSIWMRSAGYDLAFVMGGAFVTLALAGAVTAMPALLPIAFWVWLVGFEGSHFWATFSRTYFDRRFSEENPRVLMGSLLFFAIPALAVAAKLGSGSGFYMDLYGLFIFVWSLWHNVRQHYGFLNIYVKKSGNPQSIAVSYRNLIYFAICGAQIFFLFHLKGPLSLSAFPAFDGLSPLWQSVLTYGPYLISAVALAWLVALAAKSFSSAGIRGMVPALFTAVCLIFYSVMFYVIAPHEPFFSGHATNAQLIMLVTIMNSLFHNIQYHAIVWHYSESRYVKGPKDRFGLAARINRSIPSYAAAALVLGAAFGWIVWHMGDWPSVFGNQPGGFGAWGMVAYTLYFGIVGHHFYLDAKIWRPSQQRELSQYLGLVPQGA